MKLYKIALALMVCVPMCMTSCKKKSTTQVVTPVVDSIDTVHILSANRWALYKMWSDLNSNGVIDSAREWIVLPLSTVQVYTFFTNGILGDTSLGTGAMARNGLWRHVTGSESSLSIAADSAYYELFTIKSLTDSTMVLDRTDAGQYWYLTKY